MLADVCAGQAGSVVGQVEAGERRTPPSSRAKQGQAGTALDRQTPYQIFTERGAGNSRQPLARAAVGRAGLVRERRLGPERFVVWSLLTSLA